MPTGDMSRVDLKRAEIAGHKYRFLEVLFKLNLFSWTTYIGVTSQLIVGTI